MRGKITIEADLESIVDIDYEKNLKDCIKEEVIRLIRAEVKENLLREGRKAIRKYTKSLLSEEDPNEIRIVISPEDIR